jgi:hypothetical protein
VIPWNEYCPGVVGGSGGGDADDDDSGGGEGNDGTSRSFNSLSYSSYTVPGLMTEEGVGGV